MFGRLCDRRMLVAYVAEMCITPRASIAMFFIGKETSKLAAPDELRLEPNQYLFVCILTEQLNEAGKHKYLNAKVIIVGRNQLMTSSIIVHRLCRTSFCAGRGLGTNVVELIRETEIRKVQFILGSRQSTQRNTLTFHGLKKRQPLTALDSQ